MTDLDRLLRIACKNGYSRLVRPLIDAGARPNVFTCYYPLHLAVLAGSLNTVECLIANGADVNITTLTVRISPLHWACSFGNIDIVRFLVEHGAYISHCSIYGNNPFHSACAAGHVEIAEYLLQHCRFAFERDASRQFISLDDEATSVQIAAIQTFRESRRDRRALEEMVAALQALSSA